ncbi:MAG TPA: protein kinase, partial [Gemmatimonadales bacterium]|nr:protein kinase [Gemmatimonadales bacterium]
ELAAVLGAERFVQEITTTAQLQHPHILPLFDSGAADGFLFYVMPYIEGETLRNRLDRDKQLGIQEAVRITTEVADALDYAHRHGVIHRDIKPENILLHDGRPMVADFGIALAVSAAAGGRMTETGLSLGTPHYMSPEQATAEKDITAKSDVYSLASVLYEMLTGQPPHLGGTAQQIIMKIIAEPVPAVTSLRKSVPPNVAAALMKALEKLPADRFESAKAFADALTNPHFVARDTVALATRATTPQRAAWSLGLLLAGIGGFALAWVIRGKSVDHGDPSPSLRFTVPHDSTIKEGWFEGINLLTDGSGRATLADGPSGRGVYLQSFTGAPTRFLPAPDASVGGIPLPDGSGITYYTFLTNGLARLRIAPFSGSPPRTLTDSVGWWPSLDDRGRLYATGHSDAVIVRVDLGTQRVERLTELDSARGETSHTSPVILAGGRRVIYTIWSRGPSGTEAEIAVVDVEKHSTRRLFAGDHPTLLPNGYLVFGDSSGAINAVRFDTVSLTVQGDPVPVLQGVAGYRGLGRLYTVSRNGSLLFQPASLSGWAIEREAPGGVERLLHIDGPVPDWFRLHPDGRHVADIESHTLTIRSLDGTVRRVSLDGSGATIGGWSPRGDSIAVWVTRLDSGQVRARGYAVSLDGGAPVQLPIPEHPGAIAGLEWGRRGMAYRDGWLPAGGQTVESLGEPMGSPRLSPDGRYIAYEVGIGGARQVIVRELPPGSGRWEVATGNSPHWSLDGKFLYYASPLRAYQAAPDSVMRVPVLPGASFSWGSVTVAARVPPRATGAWEIGPRDGLVYWLTQDKGLTPILITNFPHLVDSIVRGASSR